MNTDGQSALVQRYPGYFINREFSTEHRNVTKLEIESTKWNCREHSLLPLISVTRYSFSTLCSHRRSLWTRLQQRATRVYSTWLDLFILTKITRGLARHVIDRTTLRQFIFPFFLFPCVSPPLFLLHLFCFRSSSFVVDLSVFRQPVHACLPRRRSYLWNEHSTRPDIDFL